MFKYSHSTQWIYLGAAPSWDLSSRDLTVNTGQEFTLTGQGFALNEHLGKQSRNQKWFSPNSAPNSSPLLPQNTENISFPLRNKAQVPITKIEIDSWGKQGIVWSPSFPCPLDLPARASWQPRLCLPTELCVTTHVVPYPSQVPLLLVLQRSICSVKHTWKECLSILYFQEMHLSLPSTAFKCTLVKWVSKSSKGLIGFLVCQKHSAFRSISLCVISLPRQMASLIASTSS